MAVSHLLVEPLPYLRKQCFNLFPQLDKCLISWCFPVLLHIPVQFLTFSGLQRIGESTTERAEAKSRAAQAHNSENTWCRILRGGSEHDAQLEWRLSAHV